MRSYAPGFIFTTALPPPVAAAATAAIRHLKVSSAEREGQQRAVRLTRERLKVHSLPVMDTPTHILPVMIGDAEKCKAASDRLLEKHGIYIQPINYPTVPKGTERLRITPTPLHDEVLIEHLAKALIETWDHLGLARGEAETVEMKPKSIFAVSGG